MRQPEPRPIRYGMDRSQLSRMPRQRGDNRLLTVALAALLIAAVIRLVAVATDPTDLPARPGEVTMP